MSEARIDRLDTRLARIEAELADKRRRHYNWRVRAAMTAACIAAPSSADIGAVLNRSLSCD
jgi:hypothetical protein